MKIHVFRYILGNGINNSKVQHIEGLRVADIVEFASTHIDINSYFPEDCLQGTLSSMGLQFGFVIFKLINIVATLFEEEFRIFVYKRISQHEKEDNEKRNIQFLAIPDFVTMI